ncbi:MAG: hypothetical protein GX933_04405 [Chloroflexi bacterium]|nr:hypothetical protein [Chloroflexota bacterium]
MTLSLAAFAFVAEELGIVNAEMIEQAVRFEPPELMLLDHAIWLLFNKTTIVSSGCSLIVIDSSGLEPLEGALTIPCPVGNDIAAALGTMTTFQLLMIAYACGKNPRAGLPHYGSKVTVTE